LCSLAAFTCPGKDQASFKFSEPTKHSEHQSKSRDLATAELVGQILVSATSPAIETLALEAMRAALAELDEGTSTEGLELDLKTVARQCQRSAKLSI